MPWLSKEQIAEARQVDLLTYLQEREPHELVRSASGEYRTVSHGSLVISNGAWYWNRGKIGGVSALDYLVEVQGMGLVEAVETVAGIRAPSVFPTQLIRKPQERRKNKPLMLPLRMKYPTLLLTYLQSRGIRPDIIKRCLDSGALYEGRYNDEAVCVFTGSDDTGVVRFACMRGIGSDLKRDCSGSDKRFNFHLPPKGGTSGALAAFEAPIDALSHVILQPDWEGHRLSLSGTSDVALIAFLERNPYINTISLCLDNDDAGRTGSEKIEGGLARDPRFSHIKVSVDPPADGEDYNTALLNSVKTPQSRAELRKEAGPLL